MEGYRPFVLAFNFALQALHNIEVPLRKPNDSRLLFHRNDPKPIQASHNDHPSNRIPDIVLVSLDAAQKASGGRPSWKDYALGTAGNAPNNNFTWGDCLSTAEFRRTWKEKTCSLRSPPSKYKYKEVTEVPLQAPIYETSEDPLVLGELAQPDKVMQRQPLSTADVLRKPLLTNILVVH